MRATDIADDLRQAANVPHVPGALLAEAADEIERLRAGYQRIIRTPTTARLERDEPYKIAMEYV